MTLAETIHDTMAALPDGALDKAWSEHMAAAVVGWMQQPAQIERMARAARPDAWAEDGEINNILNSDLRAGYYRALRRTVIERTEAAIAALAAAGTGRGDNGGTDAA